MGVRSFAVTLELVKPEKLAIACCKVVCAVGVRALRKGVHHCPPQLKVVTNGTIAGQKTLMESGGSCSQSETLVIFRGPIDEALPMQSAGLKSQGARI